MDQSDFTHLLSWPLCRFCTHVLPTYMLPVHVLPVSSMEMWTLMRLYTFTLECVLYCFYLWRNQKCSSLSMSLPSLSLSFSLSRSQDLSWACYYVLSSHLSMLLSPPSYSQAFQFSSCLLSVFLFLKHSLKSDSLSISISLPLSLCFYFSFFPALRISQINTVWLHWCLLKVFSIRGVTNFKILSKI